ncbi:hypothetical protein N7539_003651 [Penicillium diatomitis]|uniref:Uncharacterized protein n=1 Tax=Penicillium diatomitis TaxID=2819901 RepID=A0A9W9XCQ1_9EURO|nr:uncharacterized protein N7539_003651 [Penicillium diatomitis]KAJ5488761.1 hypothetical protein N7539_003651 [Penicillium diatomitis]
MESAWPQPTFDNSQFNDVFRFAESFESHCARVYHHATRFSDERVPADYVVELVLQAYRAVRSLHLHHAGNTYLDTETAIAALQSRAAQHREPRKRAAPDHQSLAKPQGSRCLDRRMVKSNSAGDVERTLGKRLERHIDGLLDDDIEDEDEDPDWSESSEGERTEDEYYEYNEESSESEDEPVGSAHRMHRVRTIQELPEDDIPEISRSPPIGLVINANGKMAHNDDAFTPPIMSTEEQATHDRISAALQRISDKFEDAETVPLTRVSARENEPLQPTPPSTDDSNSEATTIRPESSPEPLSLLQTATDEVSSSLRLTMRPAHDTLSPNQRTSSGEIHHVVLPGRLTRRASVAVLPRRIKTVCHRYVRKAMMPLRGKIQ